jgi:hypothetical protein
VVAQSGLSTVWDRTIGFQLGRDSPFSLWGMHPSLGWLQDLLKGAVGALAIGVAFVPRRKSPLQLAALAAALLIALQLVMSHWFYLYIVWWFPLALAAFILVLPAPVSARSTSQAEAGPTSPDSPSPTGPLPRSRTEPASASRSAG